ncbi:hypothetical protein TgHK011_006926 [Trichoderma gracile]|nr:hypothetical protein TgHK011_006926 [Trichoderma gracile]
MTKLVFEVGRCRRAEHYTSTSTEPGCLSDATRSIALDRPLRTSREAAAFQPLAGINHYSTSEQGGTIEGTAQPRSPTTEVDGRLMDPATACSMHQVESRRASASLCPAITRFITRHAASLRAGDFSPSSSPASGAHHHQGLDPSDCWLGSVGPCRVVSCHLEHHGVEQSLLLCACDSMAGPPGQPSLGKIMAGWNWMAAAEPRKLPLLLPRFLAFAESRPCARVFSTLPWPYRFVLVAPGGRNGLSCWLWPGRSSASTADASKLAWLINLQEQAHNGLRLGAGRHTVTAPFTIRSSEAPFSGIPRPSHRHTKYSTITL